jgi:hypothetical protein
MYSVVPLQLLLLKAEMVIEIFRTHPSRIDDPNSRLPYMPPKYPHEYLFW